MHALFLSQPTSLCHAHTQSLREELQLCEGTAREKQGELGDGYKNKAKKQEKRWKEEESSA